jgi:protein-disulfide isomerase
MSFFRRIAPLALLPILMLAACGQDSPSAATGDQIRSYLLENPEVVEEALTKLQEKRQVAADTQLREALVKNRAALERDPRDYVHGNPNGKVTIVEFFDYRCPYCKSAIPAIEELLEKNKDVRLVMKEYPILSPASEAAARAALGAQAQGKYWPVHVDLMAEQNLDDASIMRILRENEVDVAKAVQAGTGPASNDLLEDVRDLARLTGVSGTPAFVIGDKVVAGWMPEEIEKAIVAAREASQGTSNPNATGQSGG